MYAGGPPGAAELAGALAETGALLAPVVWLVVNEVANRSVELAVDGAWARLRAALRRVFRRRRGGAPGPGPDPDAVVRPLDPAQLRAVHHRVRECADAAGHDPAVAERLADAVVSRLAREADGPNAGA